MSDELKIELQVEADDKIARSQLDNLIDEYKNKRPIDIEVKLGNTNLNEFQSNIKSITSSLDTLSKIDFSNLKSIESNLKNISKVASEYQKTLASTTTTSNQKSSGSSSILDTLPDFENEKIERLHKDQKEALEQVKVLKVYAEEMEDMYGQYGQSIKNAYKKLREANPQYFSEVNDYETMFDTKHFEKLVGYYKELDHVIKEYNSLGVNLTQIDKITNERYDGTMGYRRYQQYVDSMGLSNTKFEELVVRAKDLNAKKNGLLTNIKNNLKKASDEEKIALEYLNDLYKKMPDVNLGEASAMKKYMTDVMKGTFEFDFDDLDLRFEEDFERLYKRFFAILDEVKDEYNQKFKDVDGLEGFNIFDTDSLRKESEKLDKEIINTANSISKLKDLSSDTLKTLGLNDNSINTFRELTNSVEELETKLTSLKEKLSNTFEISEGSVKSLDKIKETLIEINKLTEEQKQVFFDLGLDTENIENIKKAKDETKELKEATENVNNISFDGLIESYSILRNKAGDILSETEKLRTSAMSTVTLNYKYEEDDLTGELSRDIDTVKYTEEISKRASQLVKEYEKASNDLIKAQKEYHQALGEGKSSEGTVAQLTENINKMEANLKKVRDNINDLENYASVYEDVYEKFNKIDETRYKQAETDALKIVDKAYLADANKILKNTKTLIDEISKGKVQLQKDINAGYSNTAKELEAAIELQEKQVTKNLSKLIRIPNAKAATDQIFAYQLSKAQKTEIEIARIKDKANKTTGTKIVDEQDQYLKKYKETLTQIKAITKSLAKENTDSMSSAKILQLDKAYKQLKEIEVKLNDVKKEAAQGFFDKAMGELDLSLANSFSKTVRELDKVEEKISKLGRSDYADSNLVGSAERIIKGLRETLDKGLGSINAEGISKVLVEIEQLKKAAKDIDLNIKLSKDSEKIEAFTKGITEQLEVLQSTAKNVDVSHITKQLRELTAGSDKNSVVMKSITDDVKNLERRLKSAGDVASATGINFRGFFDDLGSSLSTFTLGEVLGDVITDALYQTVDVIKEMDAAMSNLKKVADVSDINTSEKLDGIRGQAIDIAKEVGMASSDVINAIADTLQAGIGSMEESIQVARSAMILANVGDMTQEAASEALNTIINSYNLKPLNEIDVKVGGLTQRTTELANAMDLLNYAGNNYAIGADGVAEAMARGGTVLSQYGVAMEDAVGLITAANESIQDPAKVGNALKSLAINMSGLKANASKGTMELNKTAKALKEIAGIDVYSDKSKGQVKDMVTILDELNVKLKEGKLNQDEFLALSEALAGKEQAAVFQALMGNYETFKQIQGEFAEGLHFGSAEKENAAYVDSLNGKLNKLKEVWIDTLMVLADSDALKGLLDTFITISEGINVLIKTLDKANLAFPVLFGTISGGSSFFKTLQSGLKAAGDEGVNLGLNLEGIGNTVKKGVLPAITNFVKQGLLIGGVTYGVQLLADGWDYLNNNLKNTANELENVRQEQLQEINSNKEKINILDTVGKQYEELANKAKRTAEEEDEMLRLGNELAKVLPQIKIGEDENGNAIINMTQDMEGYKDSIELAIEAQERLMLATNLEAAQNAIKQRSTGEGWDWITGKGGTDKQSLTAQQEYNEAYAKLQSEKMTLIHQSFSEEEKVRKNALKRMAEIQSEELALEAEYSSKVAELVNENIAQSNALRNTATSWITTSAQAIGNITPELTNSMKEFVNLLDFSEINTDAELVNIQKIFTELPKLAANGTVDLDNLKKSLNEINTEFNKTQDINKYNEDMSALAKTISDATGWDINTLVEMFTQMDNLFLKSAGTLETYLDSFGKNLTQLKNGDKVAEALQTQFDSINQYIDDIVNSNGDIKVQKQLLVDLKDDPYLPSNIKKLMSSLEKAGLKEEQILNITAQALVDFKDGGLENFDELKVNITSQLYKAGMELEDANKLAISMTAELEEMDVDTVLKELEAIVGKEEISKGINIKTNGSAELEELKKDIEALEADEDVIKAISAVVEGEEDLALFSQILKNIPIDDEYKTQFIVDNAQALSQLKDYQEVLDYINGLPSDVKKTYGIAEEGVSETTEKVEKINKIIDSVNDKEINVQANGDNVLQTIEDVEALIEISAKVEDGKYKIDIDANTQAAIDNINKFKDAINDLNSNLSKSKTVSYKAETAQAAKNITGLINKVNAIKKLTGKTFKYYSVTAQAAKNITGLINKVNEINKKNGKTFTWYANTAQAAKNISGLINRVNQINGLKSSRTFSYTTTVKEKKTVSAPSIDTPTIPNTPSTVSDSVSPVSAVADEIAAQTSNIQASLRTGIGEISSFSSNMARATSKTPININYGNSINAIKYNVELLQELQNRIDKVSNSISLLDKKMENAMGTTKIKYLQEQNKLYQEQANIQKELESSLKKQQSSYKSYLQNKGFSFNADGNLTNYEEKLLAMQKEAERLNNLADAANDKYNNYSGDNEKYKNQLKSTYEAAKKKADNYSESLSEIQQFLNAYIDVTFTELPKVQEEWQDLQNAITENKIAILEAKDELSDINLDIRTNNIENALAKIKKELNSLEREIDKSFGSKRESLLTNKINKLKEEQNKLHQLANAYRVQRNEISNFLNTQGFKFDKDGNITNLDNILKYQNDPAMLQYLQNLIDKYEGLGSTIDGFSEEWWDLQGSIEDTKDEIEEARKELASFLEEAKIEALTDKFNDLANTLDLIDKKLEHATGKDKLDLISQKLELIKQQQKEVEKQQEFFSKKRGSLQSELKGLGFKFDSSGDITNYVTQLEKLANSSSDFEEVKEKLEEYLNIQNEELPNLVNSWQDFESAYKDVLKEQLDTTKEIEDKITDIYKKQVEDRIDAMNKETDAKIKALKKQQDAYNAYRDEVDYQEEYDEKLQEITDLQKQLDIAMRDTSLNGQKKVQELQLQIAEAQKELQKLTQDKIDQNINDMFDKESERIEEENEKNIEKLENQWSDTKIAQMVAQALGSGIFTDIEGNVSSLEDALVDFADETGELFGILGATIKSELITNLEIAKDTVNSLATIMKELDLSAYVSAQNTRSISSATSRMATSGSYSDINNQVTITAPIINIEGNVDSNVVNELKNISNKIKEQVIDAIAGSIR